MRKRGYKYRSNRRETYGQNDRPEAELQHSPSTSGEVKQRELLVMRDAR